MGRNLRRLIACLLSPTESAMSLSRDTRVGLALASAFLIAFGFVLLRRLQQDAPVAERGAIAGAEQQSAEISPGVEVVRRPASETETEAAAQPVALPVTEVPEAVLATIRGEGQHSEANVADAEVGESPEKVAELPDLPGEIVLEPADATSGDERDPDATPLGPPGTPSGAAVVVQAAPGAAADGARDSAESSPLQPQDSPVWGVSQMQDDVAYSKSPDNGPEHAIGPETPFPDLADSGSGESDVALDATDGPPIVSGTPDVAPTLTAISSASPSSSEFAGVAEVGADEASEPLLEESGSMPDTGSARGGEDSSLVTTLGSIPAGDEHEIGAAGVATSAGIDSEVPAPTQEAEPEAPLPEQLTSSEVPGGSTVNAAGGPEPASHGLPEPVPASPGLALNPEPTAEEVAEAGLPPLTTEGTDAAEGSPFSPATVGESHEENLPSVVGTADGAAPTNRSVAGTTDAPKVYTVKKGDSLWTIARRVLGRGARWREIYELNRDVLKDPDNLRPGLQLKLPIRDQGTASRLAIGETTIR